MLRLKVYTTSPSPDFQDSYTTLSFKRCTEQQQCEISVCVCVCVGGAVFNLYPAGDRISKKHLAF